MNQLLAQVRSDQRESWLCGNGRLAEHFFAQHPELRADKEAALDLIYGELLLRTELGQSWLPAEYVDRFPEYECDIQRQLALHQILAAVDSDAGRNERPIDETPLPRVPGYLVTRRLGNGARGVVFEARQLSLGRHVALKVRFRDKTHLKSEIRNLLRREAEAIARLQHPNIVQIIDFGEIEDEPFFVMELMDGGTLEDMLSARPQKPAWAAALVEQLAQAAHIMHHAGIVHRDLKPSNVLLTKSGIPKIADFGLCNRVCHPTDEVAIPGGFYGTPGYMAPEQASASQSVGPAADIYALGVILYECLTGSLPFVGTELWEMLSGENPKEPVPPPGDSA